MYEEILKLFPVFIGAILGWGGGAISQYLSHRYSEKRELKKRKTEKIEALVASIYASEHWISEKFNTLIFKQVDHEVRSPLDEVRMIQALYFPDLAAEVVSIQEAIIPLIKFIHDQRISRMADEATWISTWDPSKYNLMYADYLDKTRNAVKKCRTLMGI